MLYVKDLELIIQKRTKHTALIDCELLSKVYINLLIRKNQYFNLKKIQKMKLIQIK